MMSSGDLIDAPISYSVIVYHTQACLSEIFALPPLNPHQPLDNTSQGLGMEFAKGRGFFIHFADEHVPL